MRAGEAPPVPGTPGTWIGNPAETFTSSVIGNIGANSICFDVDDWICAEVPLAGSGPTVYTSRDWNAGSRVALKDGDTEASS